MRASRKLLDQPRAKQYPWKPAAEKWSPTKLSRWRDGWNTSQSSTPERRLLSPQQWTPLPIMEELEATPTLEPMARPLGMMASPRPDQALQEHHFAAFTWPRLSNVGVTVVFHKIREMPGSSPWITVNSPTVQLANANSPTYKIE